MANNAPDYASLTRICEFARRLHRLGGEDALFVNSARDARCHKASRNRR
jgi:hypothetical protein